MQYRVSDDQVSEVIEADSMEDALEQAADLWKDGSWDSKCIIDLVVSELDVDGNEVDTDYISVECGEDPEPPSCTEDEHEWDNPHEIVGGLKENPGVWSLGGTTLLFKSVCVHCGLIKRETHFGVQRNPNQCDTVEYSQE
jgi:hypothetical protein